MTTEGKELIDFLVSRFLNITSAEPKQQQSVKTKLIEKLINRTVLLSVSNFNVNTYSILKF